MEILKEPKTQSLSNDDVITNHVMEENNCTSTELISMTESHGKISDDIASNKGKKRKIKQFGNNLNSTIIKPREKKKNGGRKPSKLE